MRTAYKLLFVAMPLLLFLGLQLTDQEVFFRAVTFWVFLMLELAIACIVWPTSWKQAALYLVFPVCLWAVWRIPFTPRKAFILQFQEVTVGDSLSEVRGALAPHRLHVVGTEGEEMQIQIYHSEGSDDPHGRYNADVAVIFLNNGRVTSKRFLPD